MKFIFFLFLKVKDPLSQLNFFLKIDPFFIKLLKLEELQDLQDSLLWSYHVTNSL